MRKLWVRLGLAFAAVALLAIATVGLLANYQLRAGFHRYMVGEQVQQSLLPALETHYRQTGSWAGVDAVFEEMPGQQRGAGAQGRGHPPQYTLANSAGRVVYDESDVGRQTLSAAEKRQALPIAVGGQTVGYLLVTAGRSSAQGGAETAFLNLITQSLFWAGLLAAGLALLLGFLIARQVSAPLSRLSQTARALSQGDLSQRAPVSGSDEISEVITAFNDMAQALERLESSRQQMIADIAHELRTPLTVIQGSLQAMLDDVYPLTKEEIAQVYDQSLILARLVSDLRALTQVEAGQLSLNLDTLDAETLATQAVSVFQDAAREKNIQLTAAVAPHTPALRADSDRVRQSLYNLVSNALRHTPEHGAVQVLLQPAPLPDGRAGVKVVVADEGPGLTPQEQAHVFERFWRADAARSRYKGGSGLGLTIARHLVEAQGGVMGVESAAGQGARFWFILPAAENAISDI